MRRKIDRMDALIVFVVTALTLLTNLVYAVGVGLLISCARFSWAISAELRVTHEIEGAVKTYTVDGPLFFASSKKFTASITEKADPEHVEIRFTHGELFDYTAIAALAAVAKRYEAVGKRVVFRQLSERSVKRVAKAAHLVSEINISSGEINIAGATAASPGAPTSPGALASPGAPAAPTRIVRAASYDSLALDISANEPESHSGSLSGPSVTSRDPRSHPGLTFATGFAGVKRSKKIKYKRAHVQLREENDDPIANL